MIKCFSCFRGKTQSHTSRIVSLLQQVTSKRTCNVETAPPAIADMIPKPRMSGWMSHFTLWVVVVVTAVGFVFFSFSSPSRHLPWLLEKYNGNGGSHNGALWNESNDNACIFQNHWMPWWLFPRVQWTPCDSTWIVVVVLWLSVLLSVDNDKDDTGCRRFRCRCRCIGDQIVQCWNKIRWDILQMMDMSIRRRQSLAQGLDDE